MSAPKGAGLLFKFYLLILLHALAHAMRVQLTEAANVTAGAYSGGMRRRLSVAMALLGDPKARSFWICMLRWFSHPWCVAATAAVYIYQYSHLA